jgi:hypothetical protein
MRLRYLYKLLVKNSKKSLTKQREKKLMTIGIKQKKKSIEKTKKIYVKEEKSLKKIKKTQVFIYVRQVFR